MQQENVRLYADTIKILEAVNPASDFTELPLIFSSLLLWPSSVTSYWQEKDQITLTGSFWH
jgi:hypothetical protein